MEKLRKTNGITLIALIITIVVLVILAGVVIMAINGNGGILNNANKVAEKYNSKASEEEELIGTLENKLKEYTGEKSDQPTKEPTNVEYFSWTTTETEATITGFSDAGRVKYNAGEITELVIPSEYNGLSVTTIKGGAFSNCTGLTEVFIPKSIIEAGSYGGPIFYGCSNIKKVTFEEGTTKIQDYIMSYCTGLTEINIPNSVTAIGTGAFSECKSLTELAIPSGIDTIGGRSFSGCSGATKIDIPESVTTIKGGAFSNCTGLTEVFIPKSIIEAGSYGGPIFYGCSNIKKVTFEEGMTKIPDYIMGSCAGLIEVIIPDSVKTIGTYAFYGCTNLTTVNFRGTEAQWNAISIGSSNEPLTSATKQFNQ